MKVSIFHELAYEIYLVMRLSKFASYKSPLDFLRNFAHNGSFSLQLISVLNDPYIGTFQLICFYVFTPN